MGEAASALEPARAEADIIVLNYSQLRSLSPEIAQYRWQVAILEDSSHLPGGQAKLLGGFGCRQKTVHRGPVRLALVSA